MVECNGQGSNGDHCCYVNGKVCPLLIEVGGVPRCSVWGEWDSPTYLASDVAAYYARAWPGKGYTCADWPQNIPEVMAAGIGLCCWSGLGS